jgi:sigma-B regulation protein RsbU (phosphoserine phosphatase)
MGGRIFHQTHWMPLLQMQGSISEVKLEIRLAQGSPLPMVVNALRTEREGVMLHELATFVARDRDKYERELLVARRRLEELVSEATRLQAETKDRALLAEQMIGIVSHDLRNPLSTISMAAALLTRDSLSDRDRRTLERIQRAGARGARLISDLLDFTQARVGKGLPIVREPADVHVVVADAVDELSHLHPSRSIVHERIGEGPCFVDPNRLAQIVGNLVSNAVAYGDHDTPVTVTTSIEKRAFTVRVHNHGQPIPAETRSVIFEAMARGAIAPNAGRSVGLGLFIVRELVNAHGGRVDVISTDAEGTIFAASFPQAT